MVQYENADRVPRLLGDASHRTSLETLDDGRTIVHPQALGRFVRVAHAFTSGTPFDTILQEIASAASHALATEIILIRQLASDDVNFLVRAALGPAPLSTGGLVGMYSTVSDEMRRLTAGDAVLINLLEERSHPALSASEVWSLQQLGAQHALLIPLFADGVLVGRLDAVRTRNQPFQSRTMALGQLFAAIAAQALHVHQLKQVADESQVFQAVLGLHQSIEHLADPRTILQAVAELVVREPGAARCYAMLWDGDRSEFVPTAVAGLEPHLVDMLKLVTLSPQVAPAFDQMMHSSRPLVVADATRSTLLPQSLVRAFGIRAAMIVPLRGRHQQTLGFLLVDQNEEGVSFTEHQVSVLAGMAQHISAMIENALLYDRAVTSSESLSVINEIGIQLAMLTDEPSVVRQLHYHVASVIDASYFALAMLNEDRTALDIWEAVDGSVPAQPVTVPLGDDPISKVVRTGRPSLTGTRSTDNEQHGPESPDGIETFHSRMTAPISIGRNVVGALSVHSPFRHAYGPRDLEMLTAIALHTGVAIENTRLYRLLQLRGDRRAAVLDAVINRHELERKELVDDIHENTLQSLAACLFQLDRAQHAVDEGSARDDVVSRLEDVRNELSGSIDQLRKRIFALRPATLDVLGLEPAVREHLRSVEQEFGIQADIETTLPDRLPPEQETTVYRIVQEAVAHAQVSNRATGITVHLASSDEVIEIDVRATGASAPESQETPSSATDVGLMALIERTELAGGELSVERQNGKQPAIRIRLPFMATSSPASSGRFDDAEHADQQGETDDAEHDA